MITELEGLPGNCAERGAGGEKVGKGNSVTKDQLQKQ